MPCASTIDDVAALLERLEEDFLAKRAGGEDYAKLDVLKPAAEYKADEFAKPDEFITPYTGKGYMDKPMRWDEEGRPYISANDVTERRPKVDSAMSERRQNSVIWARI